MKQPTTKLCSGCSKTKTHTKWYFDDFCPACHQRLCRLQSPERYKAAEKRRKKTSAERSREWREKNPERHQELKRRDYTKNKHKFLARNASRKARAKLATPEWITPEQRAQIQEIYRTCPPGFHVDHIVPLKGKNVSGLHLPWNLQHLPALENNRKNNKF